MSYSNVEKFLMNCEKPEDYNFEFEFDVKNYDEKMPILDRYFVYQAWRNKDLKDQILKEKNINEEQYNKQSDPDSSDGKCKLTVDVYETLWDWKTNDKEVDGTSVGKIDEFGIFGGDTMNSVQTTMGYCLMKLKTKSEHKKCYIDKVKRGYSIGACLQLYCTFPEKFKSDLKELETYIDAYHTIGNFVLVPAYFNRYRGFHGYIRDYWDKSLKELCEKGFSSKKDYLFVDFRKDQYPKYINTFFLWDYVDSEGTPKFISPNSSLEIEKTTSFLKETTKLIKRRGCFMVAMLRIALGINADGSKNESYKMSKTTWEVSEVYEKIMKEVFSEDTKIYSGYLGKEGVIENIRNVLEDEDIGNPDKEFAKKILNELENQIKQIG